MKSSRDDLYGDLTIISPTIISIQPLNSSNNIDFHPSGNLCFKQNQVYSEIIVGEIIVRSPIDDASTWHAKSTRDEVGP